MGNFRVFTFDMRKIDEKKRLPFPKYGDNFRKGYLTNFRFRYLEIVNLKMRFFPFYNREFDMEITVFDGLF